MPTHTGYIFMASEWRSMMRVWEEAVASPRHMHQKPNTLYGGANQGVGKGLGRPCYLIRFLSCWSRQVVRAVFEVAGACGQDA